MSLIHYSHCPVCNSTSIDPLMTIKDFSVSGESFVVWQCRDCGLRFTQDVPDASDIGKYYASPDYISHTDEAKGLVNNIYKKVRKYTLASKLRLIGSNAGEKGRLLDYGSGTGAFASFMKESGWEVIGLEPDAGARAAALKSHQIHLLPIEDINNLKPSSFDAITLWHVLEHVHELHSTVEKFHSLLKPGGRLFIAVPNYTSADSTIYRGFWAAYDVPRHLYHFSPESIDRLVAQHGMEIEQIRPMWFDSFYISLLSSKYRKGKTSWIGSAVSGIRSNLNALVHPKEASSLTYIIRKVRS